MANNIEKLLSEKFKEKIEKRAHQLTKIQVEQAIKEIIKKYMPQKDLSVFEVPDEYLELINTFANELSQDLSDGTWWNLLYSYEGMLSDLDYAYEDTAYYQKEAIVQNSPIFIPIGAWSDKHIYFLSCDKNFEFGKVFDCHDDYFWNLPERENPVANGILEFIQAEFNH